jgi:predicted butyrate kinase (DUF1464 family)
MVRVAGTDPGTSSLDVLILEDGQVVDQVRFKAAELHADAEAPVRWLLQRGPYDLVAGPSGYGLPLKRAADCRDSDLALMALVRPDERGQGQGVARFLTIVRSLCASGLPVIFLPGVIHLGTVPPQRKINRIDLGTADKLCVAALALAQHATPTDATFCLVEVGSAFSACIVVAGGKIVDGVGGTSGPVGWQSAGGWDGEMAYLLSPLAKRDLFAGGVASIANHDLALAQFRESLRRSVAGLRAITPFDNVVLSGRLLEEETALSDAIAADLAALGTVQRLASLPAAWGKHAAQGSAVLADGLAGGRFAVLVKQMALRDAAGTALDWLCHPRAAPCRAWFAEPPRVD